MTFATTVETAWRAATVSLKKRAAVPERTYSWASGWRDCARAMALDLLHPEDSTFAEDSLERMRDGDEYEASAVAHLIRAGRLSDPPFAVEHQQERFILQDRADRVVITGKIDGQLRFPSLESYERPAAVPFEIKSGVSVQHCQTLDDMLRGHWTRGMVYQMLAYLFGLGLPRGVLILNRPGFPRFIDIELDDRGLEMAERFIQRATLAVDVKQGIDQLPGFTEDQTLCGKCDHRGKSCAPPIDSGEGLAYLGGERFSEAARDMVENAEAAQKHARAKRVLAGATRGNRLVSIGGDFIATGKWSPSTTYSYPDDVKAKYKKVDPEGRWSMSVERSPGAPAADPPGLVALMRESIEAEKAKVGK